jgi:hypothetical protein
MGDSPVLKFLKEIGSRGGQARAKALSARQRKEIATKASKAAAKARTRKAKERKASQARWAKQKGKFSRDTET